MLKDISKYMNAHNKTEPSIQMRAIQRYSQDENQHDMHSILVLFLNGTRNRGDTEHRHLLSCM